MKNEITTKDLQALNELMTFENWMATKMNFFHQTSTDKALKAMFKEMSEAHYDNHCKLLDYLTKNADLGGSK